MVAGVLVVVVCVVVVLVELVVLVLRAGLVAADAAWLDVAAWAADEFVVAGRSVTPAALPELPELDAVD